MRQFQSRPVFVSQLIGLLLYKNLLYHQRRPFSVLFQTILAPLLFLAVLKCLQHVDIENQNIQKNEASNIRETQGRVLGGITRCEQKGGAPCITVMYAEPSYSSLSQAVSGDWDLEGWYDPETYDGIMAEFANLNRKRLLAGGVKGSVQLEMENMTITDISFAPQSQLGIIKVPDADFFYNYILHHPNTTTYGIFFDASDTETRNIEYTVWYNATTNRVASSGAGLLGDGVLKLIRGMDEAIISYLNPEQTEHPELNVTLHDWPKVYVGPISDSVVQSVGPAFSFCTVIVLFIASLSNLVSEKESHIRPTLETIGLQPGTYFLAHLIASSILVILNALTTTVLGQFIFKFDCFVRTSTLILLLTFIMFGEAMIALSIFLSCFVHTKFGAGVLGVFVLVIGILCQTFLFSGEQFGYIWWSKAADESLWKVFSIFPFFNFGKLFLDISVYTTGKLNPITGAFVQGPGFPLSALNTAIPVSLRPVYSDNTIPDIPPPSESLRLLCMNVLVFFVAAWYFDKVIPTEAGAKQKPWFLLTKRYWFPSIIETKPTTAFSSEETIVFPPGTKTLQEGKRPSLVSNVLKSFQSSLIDLFEPPKPPPVTIEIKDLCKTYSTSLKFPWSGEDRGWIKKFKAVDSFSLTLESGTLFALLGQSGAGKTTVTNILCGKTVQSSGTIRIVSTIGEGEEQDNEGATGKTGVLSDLIGVCPQRDVLFPEMTAREHIFLYSCIKNVPLVDRGDAFLKAVNLEQVADSRVGTYSGGMKRRLSLTLSTIGNTRILFLDEPTTGLDPQNRKHVQKLIQTLKKDRIVILTTHSMEEADILADQVGIMVRGRLVARGEPWKLKREFFSCGKGYRRVSIAVAGGEAAVANVRAAVLGLSPLIVLEEGGAGSLVFRVKSGKEGGDNVMDVVKKVVWYLENEADLNIVKAWGISQPNLEDVFLDALSWPLAL